MKNIDDEDFLIDDILSRKTTKRINTKRKGNQGERELVKILTKRFGLGFSRNVSSGARTSQVNLDEDALKLLSSDICTPLKFSYSIESKYGYPNINLTNIFVSGNTELDKFLDQVEKDSKKCGKQPLLAWKPPRMPWLAFIYTDEAKLRSFKYRLLYGIWSVVALDELLKLEDEFFYKG